MDRQDFVKRAEALSVAERLALVQDLLDSIQKELADQQSVKRMTAAEYDEIDRKLAAVVAKYPDEYKLGTERTIFTTDGADEFYEEG
jgi:putative addiction module component (TIGR02574 family)